MADVIDYLIASVPFILGHMIIPPISFFELNSNPPPHDLVFLFDLVYNFAPSLVFDQRFIFSLVINRNDLENLPYTIDCNPSQLISYMFVHRDYKHLISNLSATLMLGYPVFRQLGLTGYNFTYLFGGIFSILPLNRIYQNIFMKKTPTSIDWNNLSFSSLSNLNIKHTIHSFTSQLGFRKEFSLGSSGACFSLLGCQFVMDAVNFTKNLSMLISSKKKNKDIAPLINFLIQTGVRLYFFSNIVYFEYLELGNKSNQTSSWYHLLFQSDVIDHSAHLQGFAFGTAVGIITSLKNLTNF